MLCFLFFWGGFIFKKIITFTPMHITHVCGSECGGDRGREKNPLTPLILWKISSSPFSRLFHTGSALVPPTCLECVCLSLGSGCRMPNAFGIYEPYFQDAVTHTGWSTFWVDPTPSTYQLCPPYMVAVAKYILVVYACHREYVIHPYTQCIDRQSKVKGHSHLATLALCCPISRSVYASRSTDSRLLLRQW